MPNMLWPSPCAISGSKCPARFERAAARLSRRGSTTDSRARGCACGIPSSMKGAFAQHRQDVLRRVRFGLRLPDACHPGLTSPAEAGGDQHVGEARGPCRLVRAATSLLVVTLRPWTMSPWSLRTSIADLALRMLEHHLLEHATRTAPQPAFSVPGRSRRSPTQRAPRLTEVVRVRGLVCAGRRPC